MYYVCIHISNIIFHVNLTVIEKSIEDLGGKKKKKKEDLRGIFKENSLKLNRKKMKFKYGLKK